MVQETPEPQSSEPDTSSSPGPEIAEDAAAQAVKRGLPPHLVKWMFQKGRPGGPGRDRIRRSNKLRVSALVYKILTERVYASGRQMTLMEDRLRRLLRPTNDQAIILKTLEFMTKFWEAPASHKLALVQRPDGTTAMVAPVGDGEDGDSLAEQILIGLMKSKELALETARDVRDRQVLAIESGDDFIEVPAAISADPESSSGEETSSGVDDFDPDSES